jgi:hypothetical protein
MNPRSTKTLLTIAAIAALAVPGVAQARHGADDPAGAPATVDAAAS